MIPSAIDDDMDLLSQKLRLLKREFKSWIKNKGVVIEMESIILDDEMGALLTCSSSGILSHEDQSTLNLLI